MTQLAIYARYSCDKQNETSLEDQIRRCTELAQRHGLSVSKDLIYTDAAVSGTDKGDALREGYRRLREDWDAGKFDVLVVDEFSRLSRDNVEQAVLQKRLEKSRRVRLITADGVDTQDPDWQLRLGFQGLIAQQESRKLSYRVDRGMVGQLERGYMIAAPAFGYRLQRVFDDNQNHIGSRWVIHEENASIVRQVFDMRAKGESMHKIAAWLNQKGVSCSRKGRDGQEAHWRPARVKNMLENAIYKGIFVWRGSTTYAKKMKELGDEVQSVEYLRPELRLVSDEVWTRCNNRSVSRSGYGGGQHALTGVLTCGCCGATLAVSAMQRCRSLYCPVCSDARSSLGATDRLTSTIAVAGVQFMLTRVLQLFISEPFLQAFRQSLRQRLTSDNGSEIEECAARLKKLKNAQERISCMLADAEGDDETLEKRYKETRKQVIEAQQQLTKLQAGAQVLDRSAVEVQLQVDPRKLLSKLFDANVAPHELRTILARLFPSVTFEGKEGRYISKFRVRFAPGMALSMASGTECLTEKEVEARFKLQYIPSNQKEKPGYWNVETLEPPPSDTKPIQLQEECLDPA
jgi:DNA invertase Pin-like site-specific DNA recombinase/DNA-binding transcriptional MerR regulator